MRVSLLSWGTRVVGGVKWEWEEEEKRRGRKGEGEKGQQLAAG